MSVSSHLSHKCGHGGGGGHILHKTGFANASHEDPVERMECNAANVMDLSEPKQTAAWRKLNVQMHAHPASDEGISIWGCSLSGPTAAHCITEADCSLWQTTHHWFIMMKMQGG